MKLPIFTAAITILAAITIGYLQSRQLDRITAYNQVLTSENHTITTSGTTTPTSSVPTAPPPPQLVPTTGDPVIDATSFLDLIADMSPWPDQQKAQALLTQLAAVPTPTLHALLDLIPARDLPSEAALGITGLVLSRLAEKGEPTFAMQHARKTGIPAPFQLSIFNTWAEHDTPAAAAWLKQTGATDALDPHFVQEANAALAAAQTKNAPETAIEAAAALSGKERTSALIDAVAGLGNEHAWLSFARHAASLEDPVLREAAFNGLVDGTHKNPHLTDTRHLIDQLDLPPAQLNRLIVSASTRTIDADTPARAGWLIARSAPRHIDENLTKLVTHWTATDFNAAATWLKDLPPSPVRDTGVATFAHIIARAEPESAADWALTIADETKKRATLDTIIAAWQESDPDAALAYLDANTVPQ